MTLTTSQWIVFILLVCFGGIGIIVSIFFVIDLIENRTSKPRNPYNENKDGTLIAFKTFKSFYEIDPTRWYLDSGLVIYRTKNPKLDPIFHPLSCYIEDRFYFNDKDWKLYRDWHAREEERIRKRQKMERDNCAIERLTTGVKESLKNFQEGKGDE